MNQAALKAAVDGKDMVTMKELEFAKDKILMGEKSSVHFIFVAPLDETTSFHLLSSPRP